MLAEALANLSPRAWPAPVLRYLHGSLGEAALLQAAISKRQQTEAHAFIGLKHLQDGNRTLAREHLRWSTENGSPGSIAGDVARSALARIDQGGN